MKNEMIKDNLECLKHHVAILADSDDPKEKLRHASIIGCIIEILEEDITLVEIERDNAKRGLKFRELRDELENK